MLTRRKFLFALGGGGAVAVAGGLAYARWGEPHWLEVNRVVVPLAREPGGAPPLRLLQLSDFHASPVVSLEFIAEAA